MYAQLLEKHKNQINIFELYVKNFPLNIRQSQVINFFNKFGKVKSARVFPSKYNGESFATVRFFDFQTMLNIYLKFAQYKSNDYDIYVEISRTTLLICMKCSKTGHWKSQCKQKHKSHTFQKYCASKSIEKIHFEKSPQHTISHQQSKSYLQLGKDLNSSKAFFLNEQQEEDNSSLQYFCSELEENPKAQSFDKTLNIEEKNMIPSRLKNQEQDAVTNYEEQSLVIDPTQREIIFATIDPSSPSRGFINPQEISKLQRLWDEGWFHKPPQHIGAFVKISKTSTNSFFYS